MQHSFFISTKLWLAYQELAWSLNDRSFSLVRTSRLLMLGVRNNHECFSINLYGGSVRTHTAKRVAVNHRSRLHWKYRSGWYSLLPYANSRLSPLLPHPFVQPRWLDHSGIPHSERFLWGGGEGETAGNRVPAGFSTATQFSNMNDWVGVVFTVESIIDPYQKVWRRVANSLPLIKENILYLVCLILIRVW